MNLNLNFLIKCKFKSIVIFNSVKYMEKSYIAIINDNRTQNNFNGTQKNNNSKEISYPNNKESSSGINIIIETLINKKILKENNAKEKISQNKKNILNQFYKTTKNFFNNINNNNVYEEMNQKYQNEHNAKKTSAFKKEFLFVSKTDTVNINEQNNFSPMKHEKNYLNDNKKDISKNKIFNMQKCFNDRSLIRQKTVDFFYKDKNQDNFISNGNLVKNIKNKKKNLSMQFVSSVFCLNNCNINYNIINAMYKNNKYVKEKKNTINKNNPKTNFFFHNKTTSLYNNYENSKNSILMKKNGSFSQYEHTFNLIKNDLTVLASTRSFNTNKNILNKKTINLRSIGNKFSILNTLLNNMSIVFPNNKIKIGAVEKMKTLPNELIYFLYVDKINEGYFFKGIYKRGFDFRHTCNKIYGISISPLTLSYEKFYILIENEEKNFIFSNLNKIDNPKFSKTILLIKCK